MRNIPALLALTFAIPLLSACAVPAFLGGAAATSTAVAHGDRRTTAAMVADQAIELKINDSVYSDPVIGPQVHVNATSYNQVLLLTGEVPTQEVLDHIDALANQIPGVKRIYNDLQIAAPSSVESRANDSWITYNVKGWLLRKSNLKITDIKIVTERGTVYLMGLVTPEESDAVADIVRRIEGVDRVVKAFEYPGDVAKPVTAQPAGPAQAGQQPAQPATTGDSPSTEVIIEKTGDSAPAPSGSQDLQIESTEIILEEIPATTP